MCDYSLQAVKSRPAVVGERLTTHDFGTGTKGFAGPSDAGTAVCVLPGTELAFEEEIRTCHALIGESLGHRTARFRQVHRSEERMHHDCLELPDGKTVMLTYLVPGQVATVLQLPAVPVTVEEAEEQRRVAYAG